MELNARISGGPGGKADLFPKVLGLDRFDHLIAETRRQIPILVSIDGVEEAVGHAHRVVGILAGDRQIGFAIPIGIIGVERHFGVALLGELDDAQDIVGRHAVAFGFTDRDFEFWIFGGVVTSVALGFAVDAGLHHSLQALLANPGPGDESRNLLLLAYFPCDVFLDIRVIDIDDDHLCRAPCCAARLDGAGRPVADLEEAHQARRLAAAGQLFVGTAQA